MSFATVSNASLNRRPQRGKERGAKEPLKNFCNCPLTPPQLVLAPSERERERESKVQLVVRQKNTLQCLASLSLSFQPFLLFLERSCAGTTRKFFWASIPTTVDTHTHTTSTYAGEGGDLCVCLPSFSLRRLRLLSRVFSLHDFAFGDFFLLFSSPPASITSL